MGEVSAQASVPLTRLASGWTILSDAPLSGHLHLRSDDLSWLDRWWTATCKAADG